MGNVFDKKPGAYSDQSLQSRMFGNYYEAAYRQNSTTADSMDFGQGRLQFGVKMIEDVQPGYHQGEMYVTTSAGKRLYFTANHHLKSEAPGIIAQGANYGVGPAVSITGSPLQPQYHMFYSKGGDEHVGNDWTPIAINSGADIMTAMRSGMGSIAGDGKYSNMYGQASINPFAAKEGRDIWTNAGDFDRPLNAFLEKAIIPVAEMGLDAVTGGVASTLLSVTGVNKVLQTGLDSLMKHTKANQNQPANTAFDPRISNILKDPRLPAYLQSQEDQMHGYVAKYGPQSYVATEKLAQDNPMQQIQKAKQLTEENQHMFVISQVQKMQDLSDQLQKALGSRGDQPIFQQIKTGLGMASTDQQRINVINHFGAQLQSQVLPLLAESSSGADPKPPSSPVQPKNAPGITSSAQVSHPTLSINGTHTTHPGKPTIIGDAGPVVPFVPG